MFVTLILHFFVCQRLNQLSCYAIQDLQETYKMMKNVGQVSKNLTRFPSLLAIDIFAAN